MNFTVPSYIKAVTDALESAGFDAYLVGGCVRDSALGKIPHDYDITTNAKPKDMLSVFSAFRVIETGLKHGTLTVVSEGECVEVTTYRIDGAYTDNRHPDSVTFTEDITEDLSRRDFTVNAMAYSTRCGLCDPFGGLSDLSRKTIVCVGRPEDRFTEDALRILRALRFASVLDFDIDRATAEGALKLRDLLSRVSRERVQVELFKFICGDGVARITKALPEVLFSVLPMLTRDATDSFAEVCHLLPATPEARFAYLAVKSAADPVTADKAATEMMRSLKSSTAVCKRCAALAALAQNPLPTERADVLRLMGRAEPDMIKDYAALRRALYGDDVEVFLEKYGKLAEENPCVKISQLAVSGGDVMKVTGLRGEAVGRALAALLELVVTGEAENERGALTAALEKMKN